MGVAGAVAISGARLRGCGASRFAWETPPADSSRSCHCVLHDDRRQQDARHAALAVFATVRLFWSWWLLRHASYEQLRVATWPRAPRRQPSRALLHQTHHPPCRTHLSLLVDCALLLGRRLGGRVVAGERPKSQATAIYRLLLAGAQASTT